MVYGLPGNAAGLGKTVKCLVTAVATTTQITVFPYTKAKLNTAGGMQATVGDTFQVLTYGSELPKGSEYDRNAIEPGFKSHTNKPIILRDKYEVSGSDTAQIGWVEISGEEGQSGYMWYIKAEAETRTRFADYLEMAMIEGEKADATAAGVIAALNADAGTEGLFSAIRTRGNVLNAGFEAATTAANNLLTFDLILKKFDAQGAIEENMLFLQRHNRKMKTWVTGSVGAATSDLDAMEVNYLSERCLVTQGAMNFMLMNTLA